jgi:hypothetical protein
MFHTSSSVGQSSLEDCPTALYTYFYLFYKVPVFS